MDEGTDLGGRLIQETQKAAVKALKAAGQAAVAMAYGLVALVAGAAAALMAMAAIAGKVVGEMLALLSQSVRDAIPAAVAAAPGIVHMLCLAAALVAGLWSWLQLHAAYGGDWLATIPASVFAATPLLTFYIEDQTAGRAAIAAGLSILVGWVVGYVPLWLLGCITAAIYAWLITHIGFLPEVKYPGFLSETEYPGKEHEETHETQFPNRSNRGVVDLL